MGLGSGPKVKLRSGSFPNLSPTLSLTLTLTSVHTLYTDPEPDPNTLTFWSFLSAASFTPSRSRKTWLG